MSGGMDANGMPLGAVMSRTVDEAVRDCYANHSATAAKRGRNPRWPYVPIISTPRQHVPGAFVTQQIAGKAFETREQAVAYAQKTIDFRRAKFREQLTDPSMRAIRAQWGVADPDSPHCAFLSRLDGPIYVAHATRGDA